MPCKILPLYPPLEGDKGGGVTCFLVNSFYTGRSYGAIYNGGILLHYKQVAPNGATLLDI